MLVRFLLPSSSMILCSGEIWCSRLQWAAAIAILAWILAIVLTGKWYAYKNSDPYLEKKLRKALKESRKNRRDAAR